jgi:hypothetical protein
MDPIARRVAETPRPGAWLGLPLGRLGRLGRLAARPARSASAAGHPWAVPAWSGLSRTVRTTAGIPGAVLTRTRARLSRTARPHWPGSSASPGPARRGLTVAGALVAGPVRPRVPWSEFARARSVRVPAWRIGTRAGAGIRLPGLPLGPHPRPVRARARFSRRERVRGECPWPERLRPCRPGLRIPELPRPELLRPVLLGPVRAGPVLFWAMLVRPVPVSAVLPGAALLRPILLSAVRLGTVLVRPVPAGVVLLSPVLLWPALLWPALGGMVPLRSVLVRAVPARPVLLRPGLARTMLLRPVLSGPVLGGVVLLRSVPARPVLLTAVLVRSVLAGVMLLRPVGPGPVLASAVVFRALLVRPVPLIAVLTATLVRTVFIGTVPVGSRLARTVAPLTLLWTALAPAGTVLRAAWDVRPARSRPRPPVLAGRRVPGGRDVAGVRSLFVPRVWPSLLSLTAGGRFLCGAARPGTARRGTGVATGRSPRFVRDKNVIPPRRARATRTLRSRPAATRSRPGTGAGGRGVVLTGSHAAEAAGVARRLPARPRRRTRARWHSALGAGTRRSCWHVRGAEAVASRVTAVTGIDGVGCRVEISVVGVRGAGGAPAPCAAARPTVPTFHPLPPGHHGRHAALTQTSVGRRGTGKGPDE